MDKSEGSSKSHRVCLPQNVVRLNGHNIVSVHSNGDHSAALSGNLNVNDLNFKCKVVSRVQ